MAEENVMEEVMNLLEAEPTSSPAAVPAPDIPAHREQLAILVSTGKCKEAIGVNLTHEQVKRLDDKDVIRHYKRYETYVGAKTTETLIDSFLSFSTAEAEMIIAKNQLKKAEAAAAAGPPSADTPTTDDTPPAKNVLTTTQWLSVISIIISVVGIYYKRENIKKVLTKKPPQAAPPSLDAAPQRKRGIRSMD